MNFSADYREQHAVIKCKVRVFFDKMQHKFKKKVKLFEKTVQKKSHLNILLN